MPTCVGQKFPTPPSPPPSFPPTSPPPHHPKNNHTVIRRQCCETFQASCNVPSILQPANYLATSQHLLNAHQKVTGKSSERSIKSVSQAACACVGQKFPTPSPPPRLPSPTPKIITRSFVDNVVKRFKHLATCQASCNVPTILQRHNIF